MRVKGNSGGSRRDPGTPAMAGVKSSVEGTSPARSNRVGEGSRKVGCACEKLRRGSIRFGCAGSGSGKPGEVVPCASGGDKHPSCAGDGGEDAGRRQGLQAGQAASGLPDLMGKGVAGC
ncbi:hypothetical protein AKJ16_DCAP01251 [Drosera capensis]